MSSLVKDSVILHGEWLVKIPLPIKQIVGEKNPRPDPKLQLEGEAKFDWCWYGD